MRSRRSSCGSSSRRASSRRCCAAGRWRRRPDITARICGICPVAYQTSACQAMEDALGIEVERPAAPAAPADLLRRVGREPRPAPLHAARAGLPRLRERLRDGRRPPRGGRARPARQEGRQPADRGGRRAAPCTRSTSGSAASTRRRSGASWRRCATTWSAAATRRWRRCAGPPASTSPSWSATTSWSALRSEEPRASTRSTAAGSSPRRGSTSPPPEFGETFEEEHVPHSTALHARVRGRGSYLTGPLARFELQPRAALAARRRGGGTRRGSATGCRNPFRSIVVRAVEILYAFDEALRLIDAYERPDAPCVPYEPRAGVGHGVSEAPRGLLYHRYEIDERGAIVSAWIVPPTSQNQRSIEEDLREFVAANVALPDEELRAPLRADDPQLRPLHLLLDPLPASSRSSARERRARAAADASSASATRCAATTPPGCWSPGRCARLARRGSRCCELEGEPVDLIAAWEGAGAVARRRRGRLRRRAGTRCTGSTPSRRRCRPPSPAPRPTRSASPRRSSWRRALERLPPRLVVFGIEGAGFAVGAAPAAAVRAAAERVAAAAGLRGALTLRSGAPAARAKRTDRRPCYVKAAGAAMCLAIPGQVVEIVDELRLARVEIAGVRRNVSVGLLDGEGVQPGEWVLVHVGFAISKVDEAEAEATLALLARWPATSTSASRRAQGERDRVSAADVARAATLRHLRRRGRRDARAGRRRRDGAGPLRRRRTATSARGRRRARRRGGARLAADGPRRHRDRRLEGHEVRRRVPRRRAGPGAGGADPLAASSPTATTS